MSLPRSAVQSVALVLVIVAAMQMLSTLGSVSTPALYVPLRPASILQPPEQLQSHLSQQKEPHEDARQAVVRQNQRLKQESREQLEKKARQGQGQRDSELPSPLFASHFQGGVLNSHDVLLL
eukprot:5718800-Pleurochrysis_carterae.AAC.1